MCSVHANSARDALVKICTLPLLAGKNISSEFVVPTVASCLDLVVHCTRAGSGERQVTEIMAVGGRVENGIIETSSVFRRVGGELGLCATAMPAEEKFAAAGVDVAAILEERR